MGWPGHRAVFDRAADQFVDTQVFFSTGEQPNSALAAEAIVGAAVSAHNAQRQAMGTGDRGKDSRFDKPGQGGPHCGGCRTPQGENPHPTGSYLTGTPGCRGRQSRGGTRARRTEIKQGAQVVSNDLLLDLISQPLRRVIIHIIIGARSYDTYRGADADQVRCLQPSWGDRSENVVAG